MDIGSTTSLFASVFSSVSLDWIIVIGLVLFLTFDGLRAGSARVTALALALPIALYVAHTAKGAAFVGAFITQSKATEFGVLIGVSLALFIAFYRIVDTGFDSMRPVQAVLAAIAVTGIVLVTLLQLDLSALPWKPGAFFVDIFSATYALYWYLVGYFVLAIARR